MTKLLALGARVLLAVCVYTFGMSPCRAETSSVAIFGEGADRPGKAPVNACGDYPIALYPDPDAQAGAEADLQSFAPDATMIWHPARGTFWFVTLTVPLPRCGAQDELFSQLFALASAYPDLFQLDLAEWKSPPAYPCAQVGEAAQVHEIQRAKVGSHPIAHDLMRFTVQRVNGVVELQALYGEYLPPATPWLDAELSACPDLDEDLARQVVLDSQFMYSIFRNCYWVGAGAYSPNNLDTTGFRPEAGWAWHEDPALPRVLFTKSSQGRLVLNRSNHTPELIQSDANCPTENGQPRIGFGLTFDTVTTELVGAQPGIGCVVCLR